jgi:hypothetical protein
MPTSSAAWGRAWLGKQTLPEDEVAAIARHLRELDRLGEDLAVLDREIARGHAGRSRRPAAADDHRREPDGCRRAGGGDR